MQFTTVRSKEKDLDIYLKSEKLVHSQQEQEKNDIYLMSEKLVHSQQEHEKNVSQLFRSGKNQFLAISSLTNTVAVICKVKKVDPCYLETKKCSSQLFGAKEKDYDIY